MKKLISPGRLAFLGIITLAILVIYLTTLYKLQIIEGNANYEASTNSIVTEETVIAARGNILDRYGRLLVSNHNCNNLLIDTDELFAQDDAYANEAILRMCAIIEEHGDSYIDELPISMTAPFEFTEMTEIQRTLLEAWLKANDLESDASAVEVMAKMRTRYGIDNNYTAEEMRRIAGVRYEINIRYVIPTSDYIFAENVSIDTITALMESDVPGFDVQVSYIREYKTSYAAHILGYTSLIDDYEKYRDKGYKLNATVGREGAEYAFEDYLHGSDGTAAVTRTSDGVITSTVYKEAPQPGNHVYLTIDIEMQAVAEQALATFINDTNITRAEKNTVREYSGEELLPYIDGGAVVVVDVNTGEPLCIANYPTYNLSTFEEDYTELAADETKPLLNRALQGTYSPGSSFKPVTALTALARKSIDASTMLVCNGIYMKYADQGYTPACTGTHGSINVIEALTYSCNLFFYQVGDLMGINNIDYYAAELGLGQKTGIELYEEAGRVASPAWKEELYEGIDTDWYDGDTLQAAIGQSDTKLTPIQLARYCAALANNGTVYECSILKSVSSYDYSDSIYERTPVIANQIDIDDDVWDLIHQGMIGVANDPGGTAYLTFNDFEPAVAAKTGTTETGSSVSDAVFICYAPAEDPEIAMAVVVEKGSHGADLAPIARQILEYYFNFQQSTQQTESELTLLH
ncbi:MAG: penicillin-binding transpeptidase domain-containing protein [Oscillospiraceae bacterium]